MKKTAGVAITGIGCLCSPGLTLDACVAAMIAGRRHPAPPMGVAGAGPHPVFEIRAPFFPETAFPRPPAGRTPRLALAAALMALSDAGWDRTALRRYRVGVNIGSMVALGGDNQALDPVAAGVDVEAAPPANAGENVDTGAARRFMLSNPAVAVAQAFDLSGPCETVVTACSAGGDALGLAAEWIRSGCCDAVITGGADAFYAATYHGFISLMNCDPGPCRPFDARRNGLNLGEGAALFILESEDLMRERGARPRAYLRGYGASSDAFHLTAPDPGGRGLHLAVTEALAGAGASPSDMAFINAHGTGTLDNDRIEARLFAEVFPGVPFLSTKGYTGHTLGAAGAIEAAFTVACLERGRIPSSIGFSEPDPELPARPVTAVTPVSGRMALTQTLAFGGNNAALVIGLPEGPS